MKKISQNYCIMPEQPYCPACRYGHIIMNEDNDTDCEWICLYKEKERKMKHKLSKPIVLVASIILLIGSLTLCVANNTPWFAVVALLSAFGLAYALEE